MAKRIGRPPKWAVQAVQVSFRLPGDLLERIDAYAAKLRQQTGLPVARADAARLLLSKSLDAEGIAALPSRRGR